MAIYINIISGGAFVGTSQNVPFGTVYNGGNFGIRFSDNSVSLGDWATAASGTVLTKSTTTTAEWLAPKSGVGIESEGTFLGNGSILNFTGAGVSTSVVGTTATINVPGGSGGITALTGDVTASGTGSVSSTVTAAHNKPIADITGSGDIGKLLGAQTISSYGLISVTAELNTIAVPNNATLGIVAGNNNRGMRRAASRSAFAVPYTTPTTIYTGTSPKDMDLMRVRFTGSTAGISTPDLYLGVVEAGITGQPVHILNRNTGAVINSLPFTPLTDGGYDRIIGVSGTSSFSGSLSGYDVCYIGSSASGIIRGIRLEDGTTFAGVTTTLTAPISKFCFDGTTVFVVDGTGALWGYVNAWDAPFITKLLPNGTLDTNCSGMTSDGVYLYIPQPTTHRIAKIGPYPFTYNATASNVTFFNDFNGVSNPIVNSATYDGKYLWVSSQNNWTFQIDPNTGKCFNLFSLGFIMTDCTWNGYNIYACDANASTGIIGVYILDPDVQIGSGIGGIAGGVGGFASPYKLLSRPTPDGAWVYVLSTSDNTIKAIKQIPFPA